jgi:hypothetical protein
LRKRELIMTPNGKFGMLFKAFTPNSVGNTSIQITALVFAERSPKRMHVGALKKIAQSSIKRAPNLHGATLFEQALLQRRVAATMHPRKFHRATKRLV